MNRHRLVVVVTLLAVAAASAPVFAGGPFQYHALTPCRVLDTRTVSTQTNGNPIPSSTTENYRVQGNCGVPNGAAAVTVNLTVVSPTKTGFVSLWPSGGAFPTVSTINVNANEPALANGAIVPLTAVSLSTDKDLALIYGIASGTATTHIVLDVTGYFQ